MGVVTTLRPSGLVSVADSLGDPATDLVGTADRLVALNDGNDATYHLVDIGGSLHIGWIFSLDDLVLPAGARIEWVQPVARMHFPPGDYRNFADVYVGPSPDALRVAPLRALWRIGYRAMGGVAEIRGPQFAKRYTGGSSVGNALGGAQVDWDQASVNDSDIAFSLYSIVSGATGQVRMAAVSLDVSHRRQGTVAITGPPHLGTVVESQPLVTWIPAALDNPANPQRGYMVTVYTQAQYETFGHNPWRHDLSPPLWTSPHVISASARALQIGERLRDGERYRAYVFVEQPWGGTQGPWWSTVPGPEYNGAGLPFYTEFVVDAPPINGPALGAVAHDDRASAELRLGGFAPSNADPVSYEIERSDDGVTWSVMRGTPLPIADTTVGVVVEDYDAHRGRPVSYRARAVTDFNTSEWSVAVVEIGVVGSHLKDPLDPTRNRQVDLLAPFTPARRRPQTGHDVVGREEPLTTSEGFKGWECMSTTIQTASLAEYDAVDLMIASGRVLLLQDPIGRQWYIEVGDSASYDELRALPIAEEPQFGVRHLNRVSFTWRSAEAP